MGFTTTRHLARSATALLPLMLLVLLLVGMSNVMMVTASSSSTTPPNGATSFDAAAPAPGTTCPDLLYEMDTWTGTAYLKAVGTAVASTFSIAPMTGQLTLSLWTQLSIQQPSSVAMLLQVGSVVPINGTNQTRFGDSLSLFWNADDLNIGMTLVNNATMEGGMAVQTSLSGDGTVPLNNDQYHNVVLTLDAMTGVIAIFVDSVPTVVQNVPALRQFGLNLQGWQSGLTIGADYHGSNGCTGSFSDFAVIHDVISIDALKYLSVFRLPMNITNVSSTPTSNNATTMCIVSPCDQDTHFPFTSNISLFFFVSNGNSFPNSTIISPYSQWGFYPLYKSPLSLGAQLFSPVTVLEPSWTPQQLNATQCGMQQSGRIVFPDPTMTYNVKLFMITEMNPFTGNTINVTTRTGMPLAYAMYTSADVFMKKIEFVYQGLELEFNISSSSASVCIEFAAVSDRPAIRATPHTLFAGESSSLNIFAGIGPQDMVAVVPSGTNCYSVPMSDIQSLTPVYKFDLFAYYSVDVPEVAQPGLNVLCVYPNATLPPSATSYVATHCPSTDNTDTFLCGLAVAQLPTGVIPLGMGWINNFLHLGSAFADAIDHGVFEVDYFATNGGERFLKPQPGDVLDMTSELLVWTPMERPDGLWATTGASPNTTADGAEWVQYIALGVYAGVTQTTTISIRAWSAVKILLDGTSIYQLSPTSNTNNTNAYTTVLHSTSFVIRAGWHQLMVKVWRAPAVTTPVFSLRFDIVDGLGWNYNVPGNNSNTTNPNTCANATKTIPCIPNAGNALNISHTECVAMGCCYDPGNVNNTCFASTAAPMPYRTDGHCGLGWPSAVGNISQCNPGSSTGSSCCSQFEWCGSTSAHCDCTTCTNTRYNTQGGHCNYLAWGNQARCLGSRTVPLGAMSDSACRVQCDFTSGCIGYQVSIVSFVPTCSLVFQGTCSQTIVDKTISRLYLRSCTACNFMRNSTMGATCTDPYTAAVYGAGAPNPNTYMTYSQCTQLCSTAVTCLGVLYNYTSGRCAFMQQACPAANYRNTTTTMDTILSMYTCSSDAKVMPTPLPTIPNTTTVTALNCYPDYTATFLSQPSFVGFDATNQYKANYNASLGNMTVSMCQAYCWALGAPYFAISKGSVCTCGVRLPETPPTPDETLCTTRCPGNSSEVCGGPNAASVFRTNYIQGGCQPGFLAFGSNCYAYFGQSGGSDTKSWFDARSSCQALGASLTSLHGRAETQFVLSFTYTFNASNGRIAWVGAYQYLADNTYQWEDGTAWNFADWRPNEPNAKNYLEACVTAFSNYPTPYKGSFNDDGCQKPYPYVCKMPVAGSSLYPTVYAVLSNGALYCAPRSALTSFDADLAAWYQFDSTANYSSMVVLDQSSNRRDITAVSVSSTGTYVNGSVTLVPGVVAKAVVFNGSSFFIPVLGVQTRTWDIPRNQISISLWVQQTSRTNQTAEQIIISKSYSQNATNADLPQFEWALAYGTMDTLCMMVGPYRACAQAPDLNSWTHVVGIYDGSEINLFLNGTLISTYNTMLNSNLTYFLPSNPNTTVVVGYRSAMPLDATRMFVGLVDDLRVFEVAIGEIQIAYLFNCVPNGSPGNTVNIYAESTVQLLLAGSGLATTQQFALSTTGCAPGTLALITENETPYETLDTTLAILTIANVPTVPVNENATVYAACHVNQLDRSVIYGDVYFNVAVTVINALNGYTQELTVNNTQFPLTVEVTGVQLRPGQVLVATMDAQCSLIDAMYELTSVSEDGSSAYVTLQRPALISDVIHLCWGPTPYALGQASSDAPVGLTGDNLQNIGIQILMLDPNGIQYKALAVIDGTTAITPDVVTTGMSQSMSNYILACSDADYFQDNYIAIVSMGIYEDFLIPRKGVTVCDLLLGSPWMSTHSFTATNPLAGSAYRADATLVPPTQMYQFLGGSPYGFPQDGREYLSSWGNGGFGTDVNPGGYGQATPQQIPEWFQQYSIVIWTMPNTTYYLRIDMAPTVITPGAFFMVVATVVDNHNEIVMDPISFALGFPTSVHYIDSMNGQMMYNVSVDANDTRWTGTHFSVNVTVLNDTMNIANGRTQTFMMSMGTVLPNDVTPLDPSVGVTRFLHWGNLTDSIAAPYLFSALYDDYFTLYGGEAAIRPVANQSYTAVSNLFSFGPSQINATYMWQVVMNPSGYWRDSAPPNSVQFFAGALFSPMEQSVRLRYSCDDGLVIYVDGTVLVQEYRPINGSRSEYITVGPGYHQITIKLINEATLSLIELMFEGTGLGWTTEIPADIPDGAELLENGVPLTEALMLGPGVFVGNFYEDYINETTARPKLGDTLSAAMSWQDSISTGPNGTWTIDATNITDGFSYAITYIAMGLYATVDLSVEFDFTVPSMLGVWYDGTNVLVLNGDSTPTFSQNVFISAGWHQVLVKVAARSGTVQTFAIVPNQLTGPLAWALSAEYSFPPGVMPINNGQPLMSLMVLQTNASLPTPFGTSDINVMVGNIPFGPNTANSALTATDFSLTDSAQLQPYDTVPITSVPNSRFTWVPQTISEPAWTSGNMGGQFNIYYSVVLYASADIAGASVTLQQGGSGTALFIDGTLSQTVAATTTSDSTFPLSLTQGYHQVVIKQQVPSDFMLVETGGARLTWAEANTLCHNNNHRQVCSYEAYCPYGSIPRPGVLPTMNGSFFMPYRDETNGWVQTGTGGNDTNLCQRWIDTHTAQPSWGMNGTASLPIRGSVGCCGAQNRPSMSISIDTTNAITTPDGGIGWAFGFPRVYVSPPTISTNNRRARTQLISMNCSTPGCRIYYTTDFSTPTMSSTRYTGPFNVTASTYFLAVAYVNTASFSYNAYFQVVINMVPYVERSQCVANAACYVPLASADAGTPIVIAPNSWNATMLSRVINSQRYAATIPQSMTYSGVLTLQQDNSIVIPPLNGGSYYIIYYDQIEGGTVCGTVWFELLSILPTQAVGMASTLFQFSGGIQANDGILFLDPVYPAGQQPTCSNANCVRGFEDYPSETLTVNTFGNFVTTVDLSSFSGTMKCLCVCATGAYDTNNGQGGFIPNDFTLMDEIATAVAISIQVLAPQPGGQIVTAVEPPYISDGDVLYFLGNFTSNASYFQFTVILTAANGQPSSVSVPTCATIAANETTVTCTLTARPGTSGMWYPHLYYRGSVVPDVATTLINAIPPAPTVTGATGNCVKESSQCTTGSILQFYGSDFNTATPNFNTLIFGGQTDGPVSCTTLNVTSTYLTCSLVVASNAPSGTYAVSLEVFVSVDYSMTVASGAAIILGAGSNPGWNGGGAPSNTPSPGGNPPTGGNAAPSDDSKAAIIAGSLSGVVVLLIIGLLIIKFRYTLVPREVQQSKEMDYIEEQLMRESNSNTGSVSPRARQSSLEPEPLKQETGGLTYVAPAGSINNM